MRQGSAFAPIGDWNYMRRLLAALGAACLCASVFSAGMAHAASSHKTQTEKTRPLFHAKAKGKAKAHKAAGKRHKRKTVIDKDGVITGSLKTFRSTSGYPKAESPLKEGVTIAGYSGIIQSYAKAYGVPVDLAHAVVRVESNFNPRARGSAGEIGLMQIKPATARMMGYRGSAKGLYDPETNIKFGMKYLAMAQDLGDGTTCSTILKYNAGHGARRMNPVSKRYCGKVQALID